MTRPTLRVGHIVSRYLALSETFTHDLIRSMRNAEHHIFTTATENLDLFPLQGLTVANAEEDFAALARREDIDLVVGHFGPCGMTAMQVGLLNDIPSVTIFHGYDVSMLLRDDRWVERYRTLFDFGTHLVSVSEAGRERLIDIGCPADKVSTVHLGVDVARFACRRQRSRRRHPRRILMIARLTEKKGVDTAIRALAKARETEPCLRLRVVGDGDRRTELESLVRALDLSDTVELLGALPPDRVRLELAACDLLLQPSVMAADGDQEGIPVALMEAMASGVPVIASRHSGIPELVVHGQTGLLAGERDTEELAEQIVTLVRNRSLRLGLSRRARVRVEEAFNLEIQAAQLGALLERVERRYQEERQIRLAPSAATEGVPTILFIRCVPVPLAWAKLAILARRHADARISVLTTRSSQHLFQRLPYVHDVIPVEGSRLSVTALPPASLVRFKREPFDRVVVPYADESGIGYDNVRAVALACGGRNLIEMPRSHRERLVSVEAWAHGLSNAPDEAVNGDRDHALGA